MIVGIVIGIVVVLILLALAVSFNGLVRSRNECDKPFSNPNASLKLYAVASGKTPIANIEAPKSPIANKYLAYSPTTGVKAWAASAAVSTLIPLV